MPEYDRLARNLDTAYILSFFVQLIASIAAFVGLAVWASHQRTDWGLWLWIGSVASIVACMMFRWYVKRWFRRRWPIG